MLQFVGAKCSPEHRHQDARGITRFQRPCCAGKSAALRTSGAGSFQTVTPLPPQAPSEESRPSTPRYGFAVLSPGRYSVPPLLGRIPSEASRASRMRPFGPLAQTLSLWSPARPLLKSPKTAPVSTHQRRRGRASIRRPVPVSGSHHHPHQRRCRALQVGRPGPGPGGRLPTLRIGLFRCSREPKVSLSRRSRARRPHSFLTASWATLHSFHLFRALWHWQTHSRRTRPPLHSPRLRDCQHHRPPQNSRFRLIKTTTGITRPNDG